MRTCDLDRKERLDVLLDREGVPTTTLRFVDSKTASSGLVILTYEPDRNGPK